MGFSRFGLPAWFSTLSACALVSRQERRWMIICRHALVKFHFGARSLHQMNRYTSTGGHSCYTIASQLTVKRQNAVLSFAWKFWRLRSRHAWHAYCSSIVSLVVFIFLFIFKLCSLFQGYCACSQITGTFAYENDTSKLTSNLSKIGKSYVKAFIFKHILQFVAGKIPWRLQRFWKFS